MSVTEHLMRPGNGSVRMIAETPISVTEPIYRILDDANGGPGGHVIITPAPLRLVGLAGAQVPAVGDAAACGVALYSGRVTKRPSRTSLDFDGMSTWLDTYTATSFSRVAGTPSQWLGDLLTHSLTAGTVNASGTTNVTRDFASYIALRREILDQVALLGGWEYRFNPNGTVDVGTAANLWGATPRVIITDRAEGLDGTLRGLDGSILDQGLDVSNLATIGTVLGQGEGGQIAIGVASQTLGLRDRAGGTAAIRVVTSSPTEPDTNVGAVAQALVNLHNARRDVQLSTRTPMARKYLRAGDPVYVFDPASGLIDDANQVIFRGRPIAPMQVRVLSLTWPICEGYGVYFRSNSATPVWVDMTGWIDWESGDTFAEIGDWRPANYGRTNRTSPEIEERLGASPSSGSYTPTLTGMAVGTGGSAQNTANWRFAAGLLIVGGHLQFGTTAPTFPGAGISVSLPPGFVADVIAGIATEPVGRVTMSLAGAGFHGVARLDNSTRMRFVLLESSGTYLREFPTGTTVPGTWAAGDYMSWSAAVRGAFA